MAKQAKMSVAEIWRLRCAKHIPIFKVLAQYGATMKILTDIPVLVIQIEKLSDNKNVFG